MDYCRSLDSSSYVADVGEIFTKRYEIFTVLLYDFGNCSQLLNNYKNLEILYQIRSQHARGKNKDLS